MTIIVSLLLLNFTAVSLGLFFKTRNFWCTFFMKIILGCICCGTWWDLKWHGFKPPSFSLRFNGGSDLFERLINVVVELNRTWSDLKRHAVSSCGISTTYLGNGGFVAAIYHLTWDIFQWIVTKLFVIFKANHWVLVCKSGWIICQFGSHLWHVMMVIFSRKRYSPCA